VLQLQLRRPGSFLPVYSLILAGLHLLMAYKLHGAGRAWLVYSAHAPGHFIPILLAVLLGLGALGLWIAAWIQRRRGTKPMNRIAYGACVVANFGVLYSLLMTLGYWLGFL
jgi:hypothetical protein